MAKRMVWVCQQHRKEGLLTCLTTSVGNPQISFLDMVVPEEENLGFVLFKNIDAVRLVATL